MKERVKHESNVLRSTKHCTNNKEPAMGTGAEVGSAA